jgi:hypothetical protein
MNNQYLVTRRASSPALINVNQLFQTACRVSVAAVASTLLLAALPSAYANDAHETFDTGLGSFTTTYGLTDNGFNMGWWNTGNASGVPGEIGGLVQRYSPGVSPAAPAMPRILDTQSYLGAPLNTLMTISASGRMFLNNPGSAGADLNLGFWNYENPDPGTERLVLRIHSPSSGMWRFRPGDGQGSGSRITVPGSESVMMSFSFTFTPDGNGLGAGTISGSIFNGSTVFPLVPYAVAANTYSLDCFGIWVDSAGSTDTAQYQNMYFDNFTYTVVPEPSVALLLPLGAGLFLLTQRKFRRA